MNIRLLPPPNAPTTVMQINGAYYSSALGNALDAPDSIAPILIAAGFIPIAPSGPTSARPVIPSRTVSTYGSTAPIYTAVPGGQFYDTTIGTLIVFDGTTWRSPAGVAV